MTTGVSILFLPDLEISREKQVDNRVDHCDTIPLPRLRSHYSITSWWGLPDLYLAISLSVPLHCLSEQNHCLASQFVSAYGWFITRLSKVKCELPEDTLCSFSGFYIPSPWRISVTRVFESYLLIGAEGDTQPAFGSHSGSVTWSGRHYQSISAFPSL
jgi:hypothetical protein